MGLKNKNSQTSEEEH